jgi:hypothetical protein
VHMAAFWANEAFASEGVPGVKSGSTFDAKAGRHGLSSADANVSSLS